MQKSDIFLICAFLISLSVIAAFPSIASTNFTTDENGVRHYTMTETHNSSFDATSLFFIRHDYDFPLLDDYAILLAFFVILAVFATPYLRQRILLSNQLSGVWIFVFESVLMQKSESTESSQKKLSQILIHPDKLKPTSRFFVFSLLVLSSLIIFPIIGSAYAGGFDAIMINGAGGVTFDGASNDDVTWTDLTPDEYDTATFTWTSGNSHVAVDTTGFYRVMYGTDIGGGNNRVSLTHHIEVDADGGNNSWVDSGKCYAQATNREPQNTNGGASSECILKLSADAELRLVITETSELTTTSSFNFTGSTSYLHVVHLSKDNDIIMLVDDDTDQDFSDTNINVDWGARDEYDTNSFTHTLDSDEITLKQTGFYQISYSFNAAGTDTGNRGGTIAKLQLDPLGGGSFADLEYGHGYGYNRHDTSGNSHAVAGATIIEATATDVIRLNVEDVGLQTLPAERIVANQGHMDIEYLGTSVNALRYHDSAGGSEVMDDAGTRILGFDTNDENGDAFNDTVDASDSRITIDTTGLYYIAYSSLDAGDGSSNNRVEYNVRVYVDGTVQDSCQGNAFHRGPVSGTGVNESGAGFSCLIELEANDIVDLRVTGTSTVGDPRPDPDAEPDASGFVIVAMFREMFASDSLSPTDSASLSPNISSTDSLDVTDSAALSLSYTDSLDVTDSAALSLSYTDSLDVTDSAALSLSYTDSLDVTDSAALSLSYTDSLDVTDSAALSLSYTDSLDVTDSAALSLSYTDSLDVTDDASVTLVITTGDSLSPTDSASLSPDVTSTDSLDVTDDAVLDQTIVSTDSLDVTDIGSQTRTIPAGDSLDVTDSVDGMGTLSASDSVDITDSVLQTRFITPTDSLDVTDGAATVLVLLTGDSLDVTDGVVGMGGISATDSLDVTDSVSGMSDISATDSLDVTDIGSQARTIPATDSLDVSDSVAGMGTAGAFDSPLVNDSTAISVTLTHTDSLDVTSTDNDITAPTINSATVTATDTISVTFNEDLDDATVATSDFTITSPSGFTVTGISEVGGVVTLTVSPSVAGLTPTVTLGGSGVADPTGNTQTSGSVVSTDTDGPDVVYAKSIASDTVIIEFDQTVNGVAGLSTFVIPTGTPRTVSGTPTLSTTAAGNSIITVEFTTATIADGDTGTFSISAVLTDAIGNVFDITQNPVPIESGIGAAPAELDEDTPNLTITTDDSTISTITVGAGVNATLDLSIIPNKTVGGVTTTVTTNAQITITVAAGTDDETIIVFPADLTISGPSASFNGLIELPEAKNQSADNCPPEFVEADSQIVSCVEMGIVGVELTFDKPVKIVLPGEGANTPYFGVAVGDQRTIITNQCDSATAATVGGVTITSGSVTNRECFFRSNAGADMTVWTTHFTSFGTISSSGGSGSSSGGSGGDRTPPSFTTSFDKTEFPFSINGINYSLDEINSLSFIVETGIPVKFQIRMYDNGGTQNIQHITLYVNQHGDRILNDLTETEIIFEKGKDVEITDPYELIQSATITQSTENNKAVFDFDVIFSKEMNTSDLLFRIWDTKRNSVDLLIPESITVILAEPKSEIIDDDILQEPNTQTDDTIDEEPIFSWDKFNSWARYSDNSISDKEFLEHIGIDGNDIPNWVQQNNAKWVNEETMTQEEFVIVLKYLESKGIL